MGPQKPPTAKFLEFEYFLTLKDKFIQILPEQKQTWGHVIFIHKSYNEFVNKIVFICPKAEQKWNFMFFWKAISQSLAYLSVFFFFESHQEREGNKERPKSCFQKSFPKFNYGSTK